MFDVSFSELMVIAVVALIVVGPEKLPKVARMLGHLTSRVQRYVATVKEDINREIQFEDLQKLQREIKQGVEKTQQNLQIKKGAIEANFNQYAMTEKSAVDSVPPESPKKLVKRTRKLPTVETSEPETIATNEMHTNPESFK